MTEQILNMNRIIDGHQDIAYATFDKVRDDKRSVAAASIKITERHARPTLRSGMIYN